MQFQPFTDIFTGFAKANILTKKYEYKGTEIGSIRKASGHTRRTQGKMPVGSQADQREPASSDHRGDL